MFYTKISLSIGACYNCMSLFWVGMSLAFSNATISSDTQDNTLHKSCSEQLNVYRVNGYLSCDNCCRLSIHYQRIWAKGLHTCYYSTAQTWTAALYHLASGSWLEYWNKLIIPWHIMQPSIANDGETTTTTRGRPKATVLLSAKQKVGQKWRNTFRRNRMCHQK